MAFSQQNQDIEMFNVTRSVGAVGSNFWTDIMLVQTFISGIYGYNFATGSAYNASKKEARDLPDPNTDYRNVSKTEKWIRRFQRDTAKSIGKMIVQDGRVDRMTGNYTPNAHALYTIVFLNNAYEDAIRSALGVENWQDDMLSNSVYPALMRGELMMSRRVGAAAMR